MYHIAVAIERRPGFQQQIARHEGILTREDMRIFLCGTERQRRFLADIHHRALVWIAVVVGRGVARFTVGDAPSLKAAHIDGAAESARIAKDIAVVRQIDVGLEPIRQRDVIRAGIDSLTVLMQLIIIRCMTGEERRQRIDIATIAQIGRERIASDGVAVRIGAGTRLALVRCLVSTVIVDAVDDLSDIVDRLLPCSISHHGAVEHRTARADADNGRIGSDGVAVEQRVVEQAVLEVDHGRAVVVVLTHGIAVDNHIAQHEVVNLVFDIDDRLRDRLCLVATHLYAIDEGAEAITRLHIHGGDGRHACAVRRLRS